MPNRTLSGAEGYRYAYQGQEKDPETGKEAFELRLWDSRIGRWLTTDPYGQFSPYLGMGNNPISQIDPDGGMSGSCGGEGQPPCPEIHMEEVIVNAPGGNRLQPMDINYGALMFATMETTTALESYFIGNNVTGIGFADDIAIPVVAIVGGGTAMYFGFREMIQNGPNPPLYMPENGRISTTAGYVSRPNLAPIILSPPILQTVTIEDIQSIDLYIHQFAKGGNQGQWDDELSPLSDEELAELLAETIRTGDKKLRQRIVKEQKRRGQRNKGKNRGRGDIK